MEYQASLFECSGGQVMLPASPMLDRADGGHLVILPPRPVWDRTALSTSELCAWTILVAAAAEAMLNTLPQLAGGCLNYWDAGNWALNEAADPPGPKTGPTHRQLHLHLLGRSPQAQHPDWRWGEAPKFPDYAARATRQGQAFRGLTAAECNAVRMTLSVVWQQRTAAGLGA